VILRVLKARVILRPIAVASIVAVKAMAKRKVKIIERMAPTVGALGDKYLAWAFIEAANFAIRHSEKAKRFYLKKAKATNSIVARKALAHKLARACYWVMRNQEAFNEDLVF